MTFQNSTKYLFSLLLAAVLSANVVAQPAAASKIVGTEAELTDKVTIASIKEMTTMLSAPDMEGRGTGQPGGEKAANWIADKFKSFGLAPLGDKGSYFQKVEFKETITTPETSFIVGDVPLTHGTEFAFVPQNNGNRNVAGELVFVSYGIQSNQAGIDMLAGVNLSGKVVVMIGGPPPGFSKSEWEKQNASSLIMQKIVLSGASAIVTIGRGDEDHPPDEAIGYMSRRQLTLPSEQGYPAQVPPFVYVSVKGAEKLFARSGMTRNEAMEKAHNRDFKAIGLKEKAKLVAKYKTSKVLGYNVAGVLEGSDPKLKSEAIVFSAHYDAYGTENGKVYAGAADNALGTAEMLSVAEAYSKLSVKPKRSLVFLAVTGEEYGLYGSKAWAQDPTWDVKKIAANLNLDGIGSEVYGPVKTVVGYGAEHSSLGQALGSLAKSMDIDVIPDPIPDEKIFLRSDHYSFVERGIPSLMLMGAPAGDKSVWLKRIKDWEKIDYHQPGDVIQPHWAWEGAETVAEVMAILGWRISENDVMPSWLPTSRFAKVERGNTKELPKEKNDK